MSTDELEKSGGSGTCRIEAGDPVGNLVAGLLAGDQGDLPLDGEDLGGIWEGDEVVQFRAGPDTADFDPPMALFSRCELRGGKSPILDRRCPGEVWVDYL